MKNNAGIPVDIPLNEDGIKEQTEQSVTAMLDALGSMLATHAIRLGAIVDKGGGREELSGPFKGRLRLVGSVYSWTEALHYGMWLECERIRLYSRLTGREPLFNRERRDRIRGSLFTLHRELLRATGKCMELFALLLEAGTGDSDEDGKEALGMRTVHLLDCQTQLFSAARSISIECTADDLPALGPEKREYGQGPAIARLERQLIRLFIGNPPVLKLLRESLARLRSHAEGRRVCGHADSGPGQAASAAPAAKTNPWAPFVRQPVIYPERQV